MEKIFLIVALASLSQAQYVNTILRDGFAPDCTGAISVGVGFKAGVCNYISEYTCDANTINFETFSDLYTCAVPTASLSYATGCVGNMIETS